MSVFTVHEPPQRAAETSADPQRFLFVRDGFYFWAFLLTPFWMLRHRLWLILVLYLIVSIVLAVAMRALGAPASLVTLAGLLLSILAGFEGGTLRRFTLARRGWRNVGVVAGDRLEDAELRFFDAWARRSAAAATPPADKPPARPSSPSPSSEPPGIVGLFPEPGVQR